MKLTDDAPADPANDARVAAGPRRIDPLAYRDALRAAFPQYDYTDAAMYAWRFNLFERLVARHGLPQKARMLNVGCGPFALEALSPTARRCQVVSFDYTAEFDAVFRRLKAERLLEDVSFFVGDIREVDFEDESFDIIVFHDVFYETALSAPDVIARFVPFLKRGGLLYFDIMDQRAASLWKLLGAERPEYRRYDVPEVLRQIRAAGLDVLDCCSTEENRIGAKREVQRALRLLTGRTNAHGILVRRKA